MAEYRLDSLYKQAFGEGATADYVVRDKEDLPPVAHAGDIDRSGLFGKNIQMPFAFGDLTLPGEPLVSIDYSKRIVKKARAGGRGKGTVKEIIGEGDFELRIRGIMINELGLFPVDQFLLFSNMIKANRTLPVTNLVCRILGIRWLLIERVRFPDMENVDAAQAFEIQAVSDEDFELTLIEQLQNKKILGGPTSGVDLITGNNSLLT